MNSDPPGKLAWPGATDRDTRINGRSALEASLISLAPLATCVGICRGARPSRGQRSFLVHCYEDWETEFAVRYSALFTFLVTAIKERTFT